MRNAFFLSFARFLAAGVFLGCSNDNFNGQDAGEEASMSDSPISTIEGGGMDQQADTYVPPPIHRVFVTNQNTTGNFKPLVGWDDCDKLMTDRAPDVEIVGGITTATVMARAKTRLYVWDSSSHVLTGFDNIGKLASGALVSVGLGSAQFLGNGTPGASQLHYSEANDLLFVVNPGNTGNAIQMFTAASTLANGTKATAQLGSTNQGFLTAIVDTDRLIASDVTQSVMHVMPAVSGKTGVNTFTIDFSPSPAMQVFAMVSDGTRMYAGGADNNAAGARVFIYNSIMAAKTPDVTLSSANGLPATGAVTALALANDVLVVGTQSKLVAFAGAKNLSASTTGVSVTNDMINVTKMALSPKTGLLYTVGTYKGNPGMQVWKSPASNPSLQAEIRMGIGTLPGDIVLFEP